MNCFEVVSADSTHHLLMWNVRIIEAAELPIKTASYYAVLRNESAQKSEVTPIVMKSSNPKWNYAMQFAHDKIASVFVCTVFARQNFGVGSKSEEIGSITLDLAEVKKDALPMDKWMDIVPSPMFKQEPKDSSPTSESSPTSSSSSSVGQIHIHVTATNLELQDDDVEESSCWNALEQTCTIS